MTSNKMTSPTNLIRNKAVELIKNSPQGLRYSELLKELAKCFPDISEDKFANSVWDIHKKRHKEIYKPARGLFKYRFSDEQELVEMEKPPPVLNEEDFYEPFASYLRNNLGECTEAIPLGGNYLGKKWGNPRCCRSIQTGKKGYHTISD